MSTPAWALTGNTGTSPTADFVGTTDAQPLVVKTGGVERVRVDTSGNVGIGTSAPSSQLHINVAPSPNPITALTIDVQSFETPANAQASHFLLAHDIGAAPPNGATHLAIRGDGYVGIGTPQPSGRLSVVLPNTSEITGTAKSITFLTSSGALDPALNSDVALASFGMSVDNLNSVSLGVRAIRATQSPQGWPSTAIGLGMDVDNTVRAGAALFLHANGCVGIGTGGQFGGTAAVNPSAMLSVVAKGASQLQGTATSTTLLTSSGAMGAAVGSELPLASFGCTVGNNVSLGVRAILTSAAQSWQSTALCIGMDVDNTVRAGAAIFLHANGNVGIGTPTPALKLDVNGDIGVNGVDAIRRDANNAYIFPFGTQTANNNVVIGGGPGGNTDLQVSGNITVAGDVLLTGADCAEQFDINSALSTPEPGTVLVIDPSGALVESSEAYDKKVAGVVSGAGDYSHGILLDRQADSEGRVPVALVGKVYCKVDAQYAPIEVGDLLTTSPTAGHAMKAADLLKAFGSTIGKALRPLEKGQALIPILVALQ